MTHSRSDLFALTFIEPFRVPGKERSEVRRFFLFLVLFFSLCCPGFAEELGSKSKNMTIVIDEGSQFGLAEHLFDEGDYFLAIQEYKRFIYYFPQSSLLEMVYFKVGKAYFNAKEWKHAIRSFERMIQEFPNGALVDQSYYFCGLIHFYERDLLSSKKRFQNMIDLFPKSKLVDEAQLRIAMIYVEEEKWQNAMDLLKQIGQGGRLYDSAQKFTCGLQDIDRIPQKSPLLAGSLAALFPGAGHIYTERKKDGTIAFLLNGAFILAAVESYNDDHYAMAAVFTFFEIGWYSGNIYSAVNSAHKHNKRQINGYIRHLKEKSGISLKVNYADKSCYLVFNRSF